MVVSGNQIFVPESHRGVSTELEKAVRPMDVHAVMVVVDDFKVGQKQRVEQGGSDLA